MYDTQKRRAFFALNAGFTSACSLTLCAILFGFPVHAQSDAVITDIGQLTKALSREDRIIASLNLHAAVFACDTNSATLILQDSTGAELFELDSLVNLNPGDLVKIDAKRCLLSRSDFGIYVSAVPLLDNDGVHAPQNVRGEFYFEAGRYPLRLDWFNQFLGSELQVSCVSAVSEGQTPVANDERTNFLHGVRAECFQGSWSRLPNFRILRPVKAGTVSNFDLQFRSRDEMVGIRFDGYFDAPRTGKYLFNLASDDGSRLWIGTPDVPVEKTAAGSPPVARPMSLGEPMDSLNEHLLVTVEGRVTFVSSYGKGLRFELRSDQDSVSVTMVHAGPLKTGDIQNADVRVSGVAAGVLNMHQRITLGEVAIASPENLTIIDYPPGQGKEPPTLVTALQVSGLTRDEAIRRVPVQIKGVVLTVAPLMGRWMVIQDDTRGVFVQLSEVPNCAPKVGELWSINGYTQPGDFSPIIVAEKASLLGKSSMPEPARPGWSQLANGSMDVQWVELQGLVTDFQSNRLSLLMANRHLEVGMPGWGESELKSFDHAVVSIRGTLFADWNAETHEVRLANISIFDASVMEDVSAPIDPFNAPEKTARSLLGFDANATPFQRVKVRGQVTYADEKRVFIEDKAAIEVLPITNNNLTVGDIVEAVGYPEVSEIGTRLREALLRKTGVGILPRARQVSDAELSDNHLSAARICIEGRLGAIRTEESGLSLRIYTRTHVFVARVPDAGSRHTLRVGSKLSLTGIYTANEDSIPRKLDSQIELLVSNSDDIVVLSQPPWWTLPRLLCALAALLVTLALAAVWIALLRRQVAHRTALLKREIEHREHIERQHAVEAERSRIARDLHDDLGSRLTEINLLAAVSPDSADDERTTFEIIAEKARSLVKALDVIVWAVDPEKNSLQPMADYLGGYIREFLISSSVACRFKIPISVPDYPVDGQVRHAILMAVKETLNNVVRHSSATEVRFEMTIGDALQISIVDNGTGFERGTQAEGHGLNNCVARLARIGGDYRIESRPGVGTTVRITIPMQCLAAARNGDLNEISV